MTAAPGTGAAPTGEGPLSLPTGAAQLDDTTAAPVVEPSPSPTGTLPVEAVPVGDVYRVGDALVVRASDGRWRHLRPCDVAPAPPLGLTPVLRRESGGSR